MRFPDFLRNEEFPKMNKHFVTIIMSVYNEEKYVADAIQSILNQTYGNFELIIVDDYSTDRSLEICQSINDHRIHIYSKVDEPKNLASSRNIGVQMAKGEYILLQDADDTCASTRLQKQLDKALENPVHRVVGCSVLRKMQERDEYVRMPKAHNEICRGFTRFRNRGTIVTGTLLAHRTVFERYPYRVRFKYAQDWDQVLRMYESNEIEFYNCQEALYHYYIREKRVSKNTDWPDYNVWIRNCQNRRKKNLEEFSSLTDFYGYLKDHPIDRIYWLTMKRLIRLGSVRYFR